MLQKRTLWMLTSILAIIIVGAAAYVAAQTTQEQAQTTRPKREMIVGEVIDITGYMMQGRKGAEHIEAGKYHAGRGFPLGILEEETNKVYMCVQKPNAPASFLETGTKMLTPYIGMKVAANGEVWRKDGFQLIQVRIVSEW